MGRTHIVRAPVIEREIYHRPKVDISFVDRKTNAKTFQGLLKGYLKKARNDENIEMSIFIEELITKFDEFYPKKIIRVEIIQGYKNYGEAHPTIWKGVDNDYYIKIYHKDSYENLKVDKLAINRMILIVKGLEIGKSITCYQVALKLKYGTTEKEAWTNLWKQRSKEYFPNYYYPILILKELGIIKYYKKGTITRVR